MKYIVHESANIKCNYDILINKGDIVEVLRKDGRVHTYIADKSPRGCRECDASMSYGGDFSDSGACIARCCRLYCGDNIFKSLDRVLEDL